MRMRWLEACRIAAVLALSVPAPGQPWHSVAFEPSSIHLPGPGATQRYMLTAMDAHGVDRDVTASAAVRVLTPETLAVDAEKGVVTGKAAGTGRLEIRLGTIRETAEVRVGEKAVQPAVSFSPDIISILTTKGCNGSNCHGAIAGKAGFRLSLFGYDPRADHEMIVEAANGRRVDLAQPENSLLLKKPSHAVPHGGGRLIEADSHDYQTLLEWLKQGAPLAADGPVLERLELAPAERTVTLAEGGTVLRLVAIGWLSDGTTRDMTSEVRFQSEDEAVVRVSAEGGFAAAPGLTTVLARAMGKAATAQIGVLREAASASFPSPVPNNFIDELVLAKLRKMNVPPAEVAGDEQFLRRVFVDTLGRLPQPEERRRFLEDNRADRRARLIDALLERPEYVSTRTVRFEDWYRNTQLYSQGRPMGGFRDWLEDQVRQDRPYDELVRDLLTSSGDTNVNPAGNFWFPATDFMLNKFDVKMVVPTVTRVFLGIRMECAECHNHPLENFTQDDFYGLAAFFAKQKVKIGHGVYRRTWYLDEEGVVEHPVTKRPVDPRFLGGEVAESGSEGDPRAALAAWITSPTNPFFARATVNRVWHEYFGAGIVEPFDDFRSTNMPSNRELLDALANYFTRSGFRMRSLHRLILNSRTYQQASLPGGAEESEKLSRLLFARFFPRKLPAEVLLDSIGQITGVPTKFPGHPLGTSAKDVYVPDAPPYFLATFGFPRRDVLSERNEAPSLSQALHLMSRDTLRDKLESEDNILGDLVDKGWSDHRIVDELFERAYSRLPRAEERQAFLDYLAAQQASGNPRRRTLENALLVILNSKEFQLNH